jgi:hypothetical protein
MFMTLHAQAQMGPNDQYFLVKDLAKEWLVYDAAEKEYVPYVVEQHSNQLVINTLVDLESNRHYDLLVFVEKENFLFLNGALKENLQSNQWRVLKIDSLYKTYRVPQLLVSIYGTQGAAGKKMMIGHRKAAVEKLVTLEGESPLVLKTIEKSVLSNFFVIGFLFIIAFSASLLNGYPRAFQRMYSLYDTLRTDIRDETFLINRPLSRVNLFFIGFLSLAFAYLYLFAQSKEYNLFASRELLLSDQTFLGTLWGYLKTALLCFGLLMGKYFAVYTLASLYKLEKAANLHYFKDIQSSVIFYSALLIVATTASLYISDWQKWMRPLVVVPAIVFYILRTFLIFFAIRNVVSIKNLYLISYLCIVEVIPIIIGIRYVL